ncbi:MAG: L,D-transpeptidase family protein [Desulfovibrio sp.]|nr:L,D-transpeptidase family protein [Desulfovibrio sp.]
MKKLLIIVLLAFAAMLFFHYALKPTSLSPQQLSQLRLAQKASQIVLVDVFANKTTILSFFEKDHGQWVKRFSTKAYIGRKGLGKTWEGDGKTPVGVFHFTQAFGLLDNPGCAMNYVKVTDDHFWDGDAASPTYNRLVLRKDLPPASQQQSEHLIEYPVQYAYALNISYNEEGHPNRGSAIFLHCMGPKPETAGCVAIEEAMMRTLLQKVRTGCKVLIAPHAELQNW